MKHVLKKALGLSTVNENFQISFMSSKSFDLNFFLNDEKTEN